MGSVPAHEYAILIHRTETGENTYSMPNSPGVHGTATDVRQMEYETINGQAPVTDRNI